MKARVWKSRNKIAIYRSLALLLANIETNGQYVSSVNEIFSTLPSARMKTVKLELRSKLPCTSAQSIVDRYELTTFNSNHGKGIHVKFY